MWWWWWCHLQIIFHCSLGPCEDDFGEGVVGQELLLVVLLLLEHLHHLQRVVDLRDLTVEQNAPTDEDDDDNDEDGDGGHQELGSDKKRCITLKEIGCKSIILANKTVREREEGRSVMVVVLC